MADVRISELPAFTGNIVGTELVEIVSGSQNYKLPLNSITGVRGFGLITDGTVNFAENTNYRINLSSNLNVTITNAKAGDVRVINTIQTGTYSLIPPTDGLHKKMDGWDVTTPTASNLICYTILYDGANFLWNRASYN